MIEIFASAVGERDAGLASILNSGMLQDLYVASDRMYKFSTSFKHKSNRLVKLIFLTSGAVNCVTAD